MRILKIELQNINSLKSEAPIVIDFESERFRDVGLYAITGSTGAGKTTILDAITIALYHRVPRFNNSKGVLLDVVSHGATDAFSRVTFENKLVVYEAYWGIRLASKTGKILANPQEEVSLKCLSNNTIMSTQKKAVGADVINVTQLDYDQFLRSVMLAQGEFASFLTAKGPEKGRLLEQITGEEIYKKIGQAILDRKAQEESKLRDIQSKINSDDVLTEEQRSELEQKNIEFDNELEGLKKEFKSIEMVVSWYKKYNELCDEKEKLEEGIKALNEEKGKYKEEFELLELDQKAEPFKELIQHIVGKEKAIIEKTSKKKELEEQLKRLKPEEDKLLGELVKQKGELHQAEKEIVNWHPKLDEVTRLDGSIQHETDNRIIQTESLNKLTNESEALKKERNEILVKYEEIKNKIEKGLLFIEKNGFLVEVEAAFSEWTTLLTTLKTNKETLVNDQYFIEEKSKKLTIAVGHLAETKEQLKSKQIIGEKRSKELELINEKMSKLKLSDLLDDKNKLSEAQSDWNKFKDLANEVVKDRKELDQKMAQKVSVLKGLSEVKKQFEIAKQKAEAQEAKVIDAQKILDLEKSIAKYENDRQHLVKGEPCALCGSTEHPYTEKLASKGVSNSQNELNERKELLVKFTEEKTKYEAESIRLSATLEGVEQQIVAIGDELLGHELKAKQLSVECELTDREKIDTNLNLLAEKIKSITEKISNYQELQQQKDELSEKQKAGNQTMELLITNHAAFEEKIKNVKSEIEAKNQMISALNEKIVAVENGLKPKLLKYNYELPKVDAITGFINAIEADVKRFNKSRKALDDLKADLKILENTLEQKGKRIAELEKALKDQNESLANCEKKLQQVKQSRMELLPLDIKVEYKRKSLQDVRAQLNEKVEANNKELQKILDLQREKGAIKVEIDNDLAVLDTELKQFILSLESQLVDSGFLSRLEIEKALLNNETRQGFIKIKERIKERQHKLIALFETNSKAIEQLLQLKNFETTESESKLTFTQLEIKRDKLMAAKGEIKEAFRKDQEIKDRNRETYKKISAQEEVCTIWRDLFKLIGNSKDAFNVYVQRLTLKHLLDLANVHLYQLNKRYSLKMEENYKPKEELNFNLIDHYQTDQVRLVDTSSGGEKFIISLALALGLSDLASKNVKIDSLFIDEGFGTLDKNTLETVITTLETLQSQGKMIGIISHVENLKERIPAQIQISKKSNGVSEVHVI